MKMYTPLKLNAGVLGTLLDPKTPYDDTFRTTNNGVHAHDAEERLVMQRWKFCAIEQVSIHGSGDASLSKA